MPHILRKAVWQILHKFSSYNLFCSRPAKRQPFSRNVILVRWHNKGWNEHLSDTYVHFQNGKFCCKSLDKSILIKKLPLKEVKGLCQYLKFCKHHSKARYIVLFVSRPERPEDSVYLVLASTFFYRLIFRARILLEAIPPHLCWIPEGGFPIEIETKNKQIRSLNRIY